MIRRGLNVTSGDGSAEFDIFFHLGSPLVG